MNSSRFVFIAACLGMLLFGVTLITLGSVASGLQQKFHLTPIESGGLFSILPIGILAGSLLFGPIADRYGYKLILVLSCLSMFVGFEGIAYAPAKWLSGFVFVFGLGGGIINGGCNAVVADVTTGNKGANLSLVGIFYAIGALGMPFVLGILEKTFAFDTILVAVGLIPFLTGIFYLFVRFPEAKQNGGITFSLGLKLLADPILLLVGFFLFCQSSLEAMVNNWTTLYLTEVHSFPQDQALFALSLCVAGMAVMRLLIGGVMRDVSNLNILFLSFGLMLAGGFWLQLSGSDGSGVAALIMIGAGLAAGFPVMLGLVGKYYAAYSGTAFSMVLAISLIGNLLVNLLMGFIAEHYGIRHVTALCLTLLIAMIVLTLLVHKKKSLSPTPITQ